MSYSFKPTGVCASQIVFDVEDGIVKNVHFVGGCGGNTKGVASLVEGMTVDQVIAKLEGIPCHGNTSCPDQFAKALKLYKDNNK